MKLKHITLASFVLVLSACMKPATENESSASTAPSSATPSITLYTAAKVVTMNADDAFHTALAVKDGRVLAVGNRIEVEAAIGAEPFVVDQQFADKYIFPGFIDNHLHPALAGLLLPAQFITPYPWDLPNQKVAGVQGEQAYRQQLKKLHESMRDPSEFLVTWGYHELFHGEMSREIINSVSDSRPIIVWQRSFHEIYANDAALEQLGITEDAVAGIPMIDYANGHFWETGLFAIFPQLQSLVLAPERIREGMYVGLEHARRNGITTLADQGVPLLNLDMEMMHLEAVLQDNKLPLRMLLIGNAKTLGLEGSKQGLINMESLPGRNTESLTYLPKQVKLLADGAFYSQLMQMRDGYLDGHHGEWITPPQELRESARLYWNQGYQLHIHVNGDKGLATVLDIIDTLQQETPRSDHRTVLHHYGYAGADQSARVAELGISVSANPFYLWALGEKYAEIGMGPERAHAITRLGALEKLGVAVSFHSDLPMAPAAPLVLAGIAASREVASGAVLRADEKMSVAAALRGITIHAAEAIQQQHRLGSIEAGKLADFTVLEQDPYEVQPAQWRQISIWGTVLGGTLHPR